MKSDLLHVWPSSLIWLCSIPTCMFVITLLSWAPWLDSLAPLQTAIQVIFYIAWSLHFIQACVAIVVAVRRLEQEKIKHVTFYFAVTLAYGYFALGNILRVTAALTPLESIRVDSSQT